MTHPPYALLYVAISMLAILAPWFALCLVSHAIHFAKDRGNEHSQSRR